MRSKFLGQQVPERNDELEAEQEAAAPRPDLPPPPAVADGDYLCSYNKSGLGTFGVPIESAIPLANMGRFPVQLYAGANGEIFFKYSDVEAMYVRRGLLDAVAPSAARRAH